MQTRKAKRQRKPKRRQEGDHHLREGQCLPVGEYEVAVIRAGRDGGAVKLRVRKAKPFQEQAK